MLLLLFGEYTSISSSLSFSYNLLNHFNNINSSLLVTNMLRYRRCIYVTPIVSV